MSDNKSAAVVHWEMRLSNGLVAAIALGLAGLCAVAIYSLGFDGLLFTFLVLLILIYVVSISLYRSLAYASLCTILTGVICGAVFGGIAAGLPIDEVPREFKPEPAPQEIRLEPVPAAIFGAMIGFGYALLTVIFIPVLWIFGDWVTAPREFGAPRRWFFPIAILFAIVAMTAFCAVVALRR